MGKDDPGLSDTGFLSTGVGTKLSAKPAFLFK
jgi:hypothetical protein